jgi:hypothetical protein
MTTNHDCSYSFILKIVYDKKSLKNDESESVNRMTDNIIIFVIVFVFEIIIWFNSDH